MQIRFLTLATAGVLGVVAAATADDITVTIENTQADGGFAFTPFWLGFHDGSFNMFNSGEMAGNFMGVEALAELGDTTPISDRFANQAPAGVQTTLVQPDAAPVFTPGESASASFSLDAVDNRYFNYGSMVVPTNDLFVGNGNALELFDDNGDFVGPLTIELYGSNVYDAGTEVNNILDGGAFVQGVDGTAGEAEGGVIRLFFDDPAAPDYLNSILGVTTADGGTITTTFGEATLLGRISIVPAPGAAALFGLGLLTGRRRRRD